MSLEWMLLALGLVSPHNDDMPHTHRCCGVTWSHTRSEALAEGYEEAHTCPKCGRPQYFWE